MQGVKLLEFDTGLVEVTRPVVGHRQVHPDRLVLRSDLKHAAIFLNRRIHLAMCLLQARAMSFRSPGIGVQQIIADVGPGKIKVRSNFFER